MTGRRRPTTPRKQPLQQRSRVTVDAIVAATARILEEGGFESASTNRIAEVAGVSVGSLYQYFPNKEALVQAVIERHCDELFGLMAGKLTALGDGTPLPEVARELVKLVLELHAHNPKLHRVLVEQSVRLGTATRMQEVDERMTELIVAYLEAHREAVAPQNLKLAAFLSVKLVDSVAHAVFLDGVRDVRLTELTHEVTRMLLAYFTPVAGALPKVPGEAEVKSRGRRSARGAEARA